MINSKKFKSNGKSAINYIVKIIHHHKWIGMKLVGQCVLLLFFCVVFFTQGGYFFQCISATSH